MKRAQTLLIIVVCVIVAGPTAGQAKTTCRLRPKPVEEAAWLIRMATRRIGVWPGEREGLSGLPKDVPGGFWEFEVRLGDRLVGGIVYEVPDKPGRAKIYVDVDGDESFAGEKCFVSKPTPQHNPSPGGYKGYLFDECRMSVKDDLGQWPLRFDMIFNTQGVVTIRPSRYRSGKLKLAGKTYDVALIDGDYNGRYDTTFSPPLGDEPWVMCDVIAIDLNRNGTFDFQKLPKGPTEMMPLGRLLAFEGRYYRVRVSPDGASLEVENATPQFGTLDFADKQVRVLIWSDVMGFVVDGEDGDIRLPVGAYATVSMKLTETDAEGDEWTLVSDKQAGPTPHFEIRPDQATSVTVGPPFRIQATVEQNEREVSIGLDLLGQGGESYIPAVKRNGRTIPEPRLEILDEKGEVLHSDRFKYG